MEYILNDDYNISVARANGFKYGWFFPYYPKRFEVSQELDNIRKIVYGFKDGKIVLNQYCEMLKSNLNGLWVPHSNWYLSPIPASSHLKTKTRFEKFIAQMEVVCEFQNGYNLIANKDDWDPIHTAAKRNNFNILDHIVIGPVQNKKILLTDDVVTTGRTFSMIAKKLILLGAVEVQGFFLGKTHWLE
jgi:hypothetical protein